MTETSTPTGRRKRFPKLSSVGYRFLFRYLRPYRAKFGFALIALLFSSFAGLAFPLLTGKLINAIEKPDDSLFGSLDRLAFFFILILLVQSGFSYLRTYLMQEVSEKSLADLRNDLYAHLLSLPIDFFHRHRVGELTSRLGSDISAIQTTMTTTISELIRQTIIMVGGIVLVIYTSPKLTLIILGALPVVVVTAVLFGRSIRAASARVQNLYATLNTVAEETFQGIAVVKGFTAEERERVRYRSTLDGIIGVSLKLARSRALFIAFVVFLLFGGVVGVIWYGGTLVQQGLMSIGDLTQFVLYAAFVGGAMGSFADLYGGLQRALGSAETIRGILDEKPEPSTGTEPAPGAEGSLRFDAVTFSYPTRPDFPVLTDVSFDVPAGSSLALVGPSGSGKSTIVNLIMRFYQPTVGTILLNGESVDTIPLEGYRSRIAIVPQDVMLFGGTIAENIRYGRDDATDDEIRNAAAEANALEFIESFPERFATVVGERGVQLSGGQRQRIALARAILRDPAILILDEATSALDNESERLVQEALSRVMNGRTTIVIAHRLSTVRHADRIAVLREGRIVESGSYDALVEQEGYFARLVSFNQLGGNGLDAERIIG